LKELKKTLLEKQMNQFYSIDALTNPNEGATIVKFSNAFDKNECLMVETLEAFLDINNAGVNVNNDAKSQTRRSRVGWIPYEKNIDWLFEKLKIYARKANNEIFRFKIDGIHEPLQYTIYESNNQGFYNWHMDIGVYNEMTVTRKMSMSMIINDTSEYEGGDLEIWGASGVVSAPREQGTLCFFPSFLLHRVTPVTRGTRKSLVVWFGGPNWE